MSAGGAVRPRQILGDPFVSAAFLVA